MWKLASPPTQKQIYPQKEALVKRTAQPESDVLLLQCVLCALVLAFALFARSASLSALPEMKAQLDTLLTQGMRYDGDVPLVRLANAKIEQIRTQTKAWLDTVAPAQMTGSGGFWPVKNKKTVPEGASLDDYTLTETLQLPLVGTLTSGFGFRENPVNGADDFHMGVDWAVPEGTSVYAAEQGQIQTAGYSKLRGNYLILRHRSGLQTLYQHLLYSYERPGERVQKGQQIAAAGKTGFVTGPHLHFELVVEGKRVNPLLAFDAENPA
ncbi:MAG: M23 family metallopeptidase [Ruthenibacterium sp.]